MEKAKDIINTIARQRLVEEIVHRNCTSMTERDRQDLSQFIYEILLRKPESIILDLWKHKEIEYYIVRIVLSQRTKDSAFYREVRRFNDLRFEIHDYGKSERNYNQEEDGQTEEDNDNAVNLYLRR